MQNTNEQSDQDRLILLISEKERLCLDAYLFNSSNKIEAYKVCKDITKDIDYNVLSDRANNWLNNKNNKAYLTKYKSVIITGSNISEQNFDSIEYNKDAIVKMVQDLIAKTSDIKLKADLLMKLNELKGYKKIDTNVPDEQYRLYLPLRCESCEFKPK